LRRERGFSAPPISRRKPCDLYDTDPLAGGFDKKWDVSRRWRLRVFNPGNIPQGKFPFAFKQLYTHQPNAGFVEELAFPSNPVEGNDDRNVDDENNVSGNFSTA
jgi:hypothetical protein